MRTSGTTAPKHASPTGNTHLSAKVRPASTGSARNVSGRCRRSERISGNRAHRQSMPLASMPGENGSPTALADRPIPPESRERSSRTETRCKKSCPERQLFSKFADRHFTSSRRGSRPHGRNTRERRLRRAAIWVSGSRRARPTSRCRTNRPCRGRAPRRSPSSG